MEDYKTILEHHKAILSFLNQDETKAQLHTFINQNDSKQYGLANYMLATYDTLIKHNKVAKDLKIKSAELTKAKNRLNKSIHAFSQKYDLNPPIQLYYETSKEKIGGHFACTNTADHRSMALVPLRTLKLSLERISKKIKNEAQSINQTAISIDETIKQGSQKLYSKKQTLSEIRKKLMDEASMHLKKKLKSSDINDYQHLDLEISVLEQNKYDYEDLLDEDKPEVHPKKHSRIWRSHDSKNLNDLSVACILSSDMGTGKTTFLRHLQLKLLKGNKKLPVYIHANDIEEEWNGHDPVTFEKFLMKTLDINVAADLWGQDFKENLILLIDGLDQITGTGTEYDNFLNDLLDIAEYSELSMIIASRPVAVIAAEEKNVDLLQLRQIGRASGRERV